MLEPVTEEQLTKPDGMTYVQVFQNYWWPHDSQGRLYLHRMRPSSRRVSPQCNGNKSIAESIGSKLIEDYAGVKLIEFAYVPIDVRDYE